MNPDAWLVVDIQSPSDDQRALIAEGLFACGATAVEEHQAGVRTWFVAPQDEHAFVAELRVTLAAAIGAEAPEIVCERQGDHDWAAEWRRGLFARRLGERIVVAPTWIEPELQPNDVLLRIDPEMAFGTGEHATTRGVLRLLQQLRTEYTRVLDVGTGSGILAIAAALLGARAVDAPESDPDALINARDNVERHGVIDRVRLHEQLVDGRWLADREPYDIIIANILSGVIVPLLPAFASTLAHDGAILLSGILEEEAEGVIRAAAEVGLQLEIEDLEAEWWSGCFRRSRPPDRMP